MSNSSAAPLVRDLPRLMLRNWSFWMSLVTLLVGFGVSIFYAKQEKLSLQVEQEWRFDAQRANAIKHAYAAAQVYHAFTRVGFSDVHAQQGTVLLGYVNEYLERLMPTNNPDSTLEMMKDMHNNMAGVFAARWLEKHQTEADGLSAHDIIMVLEQHHLLVTNAKTIALEGGDVLLAQGDPDVLGATDWFERQMQHIDEKVTVALTDIYVPNTAPVASLK